MERQERLKQHRGFSQVFVPGKLTFGFVAPMTGYPHSSIPESHNFTDLVKAADEGGVDVIWLRDVPFLDPSFGDVGQIYDPFVYGGVLAATTKRIAIGTAGIVMPLRDPLIVSKQATTLDQLSGGRFILGLASGDRMSEYPAFGCDFENRGVRFREAREVIRRVTEESYPTFGTEFYGSFNGTLDLIPKPVSGIIPTIAIGRAGQELNWIGENMDAWLWHGDNARKVSLRKNIFKTLSNGVDKPYGYGHFFDLSDNPNEPVIFEPNFIRGGRNTLIQFWEQQQQEGLSHTVLNPKPSERPGLEIIQEFSEFIIPQFR